MLDDKLIIGMALGFMLGAVITQSNKKVQDVVEQGKEKVQEVVEMGKEKVKETFCK